MPDLSGYRFTPTHEWVRRDGDTATVGISDHAQALLGDVIFLDLPAVGAKLTAGERFGAIESVKAASDIYSPMGGKVTEVNRKLEDTPALINKDCYGKGWIAKIEVRDMDESTNLMNAQEYRSYLETIAT